MRYIPLLIFIVIVGFLFNGLYLNPRLLPSQLLDKPMPHFELSGLNKNDAGLSDKDFKGHFSLLNIWATWCEVCRGENIFLLKLAQQGVVIYGLNYKDDRSKARQWLKTLGNPYSAVGFDKQGKVAINFGVYGTPETFLIDSEGNIRYRHVGVLNQSDWQQHFVPIINQLKLS